MLRPVSDQPLTLVWPSGQSFQSLLKLDHIAVAKSNSAWTDGLWQTAAPGSNHRATASDALESDHAEGLVISRRDDQRLMLIQSRGEFGTGLGSSKFDLRIQAKLFRQVLPFRKLRPGTYDSQLRAKIALAQAFQSVEKNIETFFFDEPSQKYEFALSLGLRRTGLEDVGVIRIGNND